MATVISQALLQLQECPADDEKEVLRLLAVLKAVPMTVELLSSSKVAIQLKQAKKNMSPSCAETSQAIINSWRKLIFSIDANKPKLTAKPIPKPAQKAVSKPSSSPPSSSLPIPKTSSTLPSDLSKSTTTSAPSQSKNAKATISTKVPSSSSASSSSLSKSKPQQSQDTTRATHNTHPISPLVQPTQSSSSSSSTSSVSSDVLIPINPKITSRPMTIPRVAHILNPETTSSSAPTSLCGFSSSTKRAVQSMPKPLDSRTMSMTGATPQVATCVPTLFEICAELMGLHLEKIPISAFASLPESLFQRAVVNRIRPSAKLLQRIEAVNPSLERCCDEIWRLHCLRQYPQITEKEKPEGMLWKTLIQDMEAEQAAKLANFSRKAKGLQQTDIDYKSNHATKMMTSSLAVEILNKKRGRAVVDKAGKVRIVGGGSTSEPSSSGPKVMRQRNDLFAKAKREALEARKAIRQ